MTTPTQSRTNELFPAHYTETVAVTEGLEQPWKARLVAEYEKAGQGCADKPWVNWVPSKEAPLHKPWMAWRGINMGDGTSTTTQLVT
ncbi:hypothetical protein H9Q74_004749 [Fusarium xylarioides]|nr:hypothetical protein H9Q71_008496 [Fusarium xylarioides]KAG5825180.1 hypothetical protein H9Q74_004749 [Fusarium xylarioides]